MQQSHLGEFLQLMKTKGTYFHPILDMKISVSPPFVTLRPSPWILKQGAVVKY